MKNLLSLSVLFLFLFHISACDVIEFGETEPVGTVEGLSPIYVPDLEWNVIESLEPRPIEFLGKIYYKDETIFVNERNKGFHVIDNSNPTNPVPIRFIQVYGSEDIAIKGNYLYTDNVTDLVTIDISNLEDISVVDRIPGLYPESKKEYPEGYSGYFECVDSEKGVVVGWEEATLDNPSCLR